jgi:hypothetical protein
MMLCKFATLLLLLFVPLTASAASPADVDISFDVYQRLSVRVLARMAFPPMYQDKVGTVTSEDTSEVPDIPDKHKNACLRVTGPAGAQYSLVFADTTTATSDVRSDSVIVVNLSVVAGKTDNARKTGRILDINGLDVPCIKGSANFSGNLVESNYSNGSEPVLITAVYDDVQ